MIDGKKAELNTRRPLTQGEAERQSEQFVTEFTYNSNAIEGNNLTLRETDLVLRCLTIDKKSLKEHICTQFLFSKIEQSMFTQVCYNGLIIK